MSWGRCLKCGHRKLIPPEELNKPIQCTNYHCRSYWVVPEETFEKMVDSLIPYVHDDTPILDLLNGVIKVLETNGITGRPLNTLQIAQNLVKEAERRKKEMMR